MSANALIRPEEVMGMKRESTLRFLEFLGQEVTGSCCLAQVADLGAIQPLDSILEGLAVEAYLQVLKDTWRAVPTCFFEITEPGPAQ